MNFPPVRIVLAPAAVIFERRDDLADLLTTCIADGASLGYFTPLATPRARAVFEALAQCTDDGTARVLIAIAGTKLAGCIAIFAESRETEPHLAKLGRLMVRPDYRRHGIATALTHEAEAEAQSWGKTRLYLFTTDDGAAPAFYDHLGVAARHHPRVCAISSAISAQII
ncbi:MAG: GNAT family N-acetyltransferase [Acidiphilium sp.]|nr:GNAT family N-acetyltransferase [Acidiphilium sp.]MDD4936440.1 GNAT family N-acetyltransferase [Acidiphilium sp.]